jgi:hypothetical protein
LSGILLPSSTVSLIDASLAVRRASVVGINHDDVAVCFITQNMMVLAKFLVDYFHLAVQSSLMMSALISVYGKRG